MRGELEELLKGKAYAHLVLLPGLDGWSVSPTGTYPSFSRELMPPRPSTSKSPITVASFTIASSPVRQSTPTSLVSKAIRPAMPPSPPPPELRRAFTFLPLAPILRRAVAPTPTPFRYESPNSESAFDPPCVNPLSPLMRQSGSHPAWRYTSMSARTISACAVGAVMA